MILISLLNDTHELWDSATHIRRLYPERDLSVHGLQTYTGHSNKTFPITTCFLHLSDKKTAPFLMSGSETSEVNLFSMG